MFIKLGELHEISRVENVASCIASVSPEILENFKKIATNLKKIAPKAEDFLYFSAVMMHAAEASGLNEDGTPKLNARGEVIEVGWDKSAGTWRWMSNDPSVRPYKNCNGDIFPEEELVKAHKKWVGKPLCIDHKSSSVDHTRGFIVDTYYDRNLKRVIALCALDKANYPDLSRKVATGMQTAVSMGTAVGRAICAETNCARVAKSEHDFCNHMKTKTGYGEINIDLNPIELSIVVNGADPKANIKHIIAAANNLNNYVDMKNEQLKKITAEYTAGLNFNTDMKSGVSINVNSKDLDSFKKDINKAIEDFEKIQSSLKEENVQEYGNDLASNQLADTPPTDSGLAPPHERFASSIGTDTVTELKEVTKTIEAKLNQMKASLDKLSNTSIIKNTQEETMSGTNDINKKGYYQGGGGVNEPAPGQAKYTKDPLNEQLREHEDKQMVGQSPFPGVGPVDGVHPSPASADPASELERKKMLARAESEERALRRQSIVNLAKEALNKKSYYLGGGGVNEPTPGKVKYPADKLNEVDREKEDKQMVGQKPFPAVGPVDGLHPSPASADVPDEKKRKEMLQRASLRGRFIKAANTDGTLDLGKSAWEVYLGEKLLLSASVNQLTGNRSELLYDTVATEKFGQKLIEKVKKEGADKVINLIKSAQVAPEGPPAAPEELAAPAPEAAPEAEDTGKSGDPKENLLEIAEKVRDLSSDVVEGVRALTGEQSEMGAMNEGMPDMGTVASFSQKHILSLRKSLNANLLDSMTKCASDLKNHHEELIMLANLYGKDAVTSDNESLVESITEEAVNEANIAIADGLTLMKAFVTYARGTDAIVKRAELDKEFEALAEGEHMTSEFDSHSGDDLMDIIQDTNADLDAVKDLMDDSDSADELDIDADLGDDNDMKLELKPGEMVPKDIPSGATTTVVSASLETKAGRAVLRAKLAADALGKEDDGESQDMSKAKFSDMLDEANKLADGQTELDVKPSNDLGKVETLSEANKDMLDVAKAPPKVRKEAEAIHQLVSSGKLDAQDIDGLVAEGLDKDAVAYYKKYFGQVDGGSEFASELAKEHTKAELEKQYEAYQVKLARSYELVYDMVDRGMCQPDKDAITTQVHEFMKFDDSNFESMKRVVARNAPLMRKEAGRIPQVGIFGSTDNSVAQESDDLKSQLTAALSQSTKRIF